LSFGAIAAALVGLGIGLYIWHGNQRQEAASAALLAIRPPAPGVPEPPGGAAGAYMNVANEYTGTPAGARALLMAGAALFDTGKFKEAETQFQRFLGDYSENPLASQAQLGVAASLEAEGKTAEAAARYKEFRERRSQDSGFAQATSALARLYEVQGKPDQALKLYQELASKYQKTANDSWSAEAGIQAQELLAKHPELRPKPTPPPAPTPAPLPMPMQMPPATSAVPGKTTSPPLMVLPPPAPKSGTGTPLIITNKPSP
jgi:tetratricopeptide (TPR) repeat protein